MASGLQQDLLAPNKIASNVSITGGDIFLNNARRLFVSLFFCQLSCLFYFYPAARQRQAGQETMPWELNLPQTYNLSFSCRLPSQITMKWCTNDRGTETTRGKKKTRNERAAEERKKEPNVRNRVILYFRR